MKNIWEAAIIGIVIGDALGCPVQFLSRDSILRRPNGPVTDMEGWGTFNLPKGSWTDDSSLTLATLDSIINMGAIDPDDIMNNFVSWLDDGKYTPYGYAYDIGLTCQEAITKYRYSRDTEHCGKTGEHANGNGSLMRIMPAVLYAYTEQKNKNLSDESAIALIDSVSALTHNHQRACMACGIYFFITRAILDRKEGATLLSCIQTGMINAEHFYGEDPEMTYYMRLHDLPAFAELTSEDIHGTGYVVETLEAVIWSLLTTDSFEQCMLTAVNLGDDTDTVAAIAGGLAVLYYGYDSIPQTWLDSIVKIDEIKSMCDRINSVCIC